MTAPRSWLRRYDPLAQERFRRKAFVAASCGVAAVLVVIAGVGVL